MKPRRFEAVILIFLIATSSLAEARKLPPKNTQKGQIERVKRQADDTFGNIIQMALKYAPLIVNTFFGGGGGGGGGLADLASSIPALLGGLTGGGSKPATDTKVTPVAAASTTVEKLDTIGAKDDIFSWGNILKMGMKIALSLLSSYSTGGSIDRNGQDISTLQTVMGTIISAMTGSEDPSEVATMAKQATDVMNLLGTLVEALRTSITSR